MAISLRQIEPLSPLFSRTVILGSIDYIYQVYVPTNYIQTRKWPVILFLHGAHERGWGGSRQTTVGIGPAIQQYPERFPCIVVFPQCRKQAWWTSDEMVEQALVALNQTTEEFRGDLKRLYLTGISMGGYGVWKIAAEYPGKFAALAPICGGIISPASNTSLIGNLVEGGSDDPYAAVAQRIGQTPAWVFHGAADSVIPVAESRKMVEALKKVGGNVRYTEYESVDHNSWDKAYAETTFLSWLFAQHISK